MRCAITKTLPLVCRRAAGAKSSRRRDARRLRETGEADGAISRRPEASHPHVHQTRREEAAERTQQLPQSAALERMAAFDPAVFVAQVREAFAGQPEQQASFMSTLSDFNRGSTPPAECLPRLGALLAPHAELIEALNRSLPEGYRIDPRDPAAPIAAASSAHFELPHALPPHKGVPLPAPGSAHDLLAVVRDRLGDEAYRIFLSATREMRYGAEGAYEAVLALLDGHTDLQREFEMLIPRPPPDAAAAAAAAAADAAALEAAAVAQTTGR